MSRLFGHKIQNANILQLVWIFCGRVNLGIKVDHILNWENLFISSRGSVNSGKFEIYYRKRTSNLAATGITREAAREKERTDNPANI